MHAWGRGSLPRAHARVVKLATSSTYIRQSLLRKKWTWGKTHIAHVKTGVCHYFSVHSVNIYCPLGAKYARAKGTRTPSKWVSDGDLEINCILSDDLSSM